ncbi:MAG: hypothetical protein AABM67_00425 [Acidobacteriota bacterium]
MKWIVLLLFSASLTPGQSASNRHLAQPSARRPHLASKARSAKELSNLIKYLRAKGATVVLTKETVSQPFFSVVARIINVNGQGVQVFEYARILKADSEAKRVSPNGMTIGMSKPSWLSTPHFFKSGKLILLYLGDDQIILRILQSTLGNQFAGG